ncbi:MAG: hypothetical protein MZU95_13745 [Desulfomicrobium escambiense]|nr:hypothetical protein [Desulfomicrobium escambiense]
MKPVGLARPAHRPSALRRGAAAPGRRSRHACTTWSASRPSSRMAGAAPALPHHSRAGAAPSFARLGGMHRNTFLNAPRLLDADAAAAGRRRACASPGRSPASRAMWNRRPAASSPGLFAAGRPARASAVAAAAADHRPRAPCSATSPRHRQPQGVPADERHLRGSSPLEGRHRKRADRRLGMAERALAELAPWWQRVSQAAILAAIAHDH